MIYGYARVSTDGQSVDAQVAALRKHGAEKVFREVASGAKTDRVQLRRLLDALGPGRKSFAVPGATHEIHHGFVRDCERPARSWNM
jgi:DNA invertase Pin-like site-specific DNA recombinase